MEIVAKLKNSMNDKQKEFVELQLGRIKEHDVGTYKHCLDVGRISAILATKMGLDKSTVLDTYIAGLLHDLGKIDIDTDIINKCGRLDNCEMRVMKGHTRLGFKRVVYNSNISSSVKMAILHHHEREDGQGYPDNIRMSKYTINIIAKIVHVADVYSAMISKRSYKDAFSSEEALKMIKEEVGNSFDKDIVSRLDDYVHESNNKY